jgi:hypothetical protein
VTGDIGGFKVDAAQPHDLEAVLALRFTLPKADTNSNLEKAMGGAEAIATDTACLDKPPSFRRSRRSCSLRFGLPGKRGAHRNLS